MVNYIKVVDDNEEHEFIVRLEVGYLDEMTLDGHIQDFNDMYEKGMTDATLEDFLESLEYDIIFISNVLFV